MSKYDGHWTIEDIKSEITAMETLLIARATLQSDCFFKSLLGKVESLNLRGPSDMVILYEMIEKSRLPTSLREKLQTLLDAKAINSVANSSTAKLTLVPQQCLGLQNYFTEKEHAALEGADMWKGCTIMASRMKKIGLMSLKECTKKMAVAILFWYEKQRTGSIPSIQMSYSLATDFLQTFHSCTEVMPDGVKTLVSYPLLPDALPTDHFQAAYGDERPASISMPELQLIYKNYVRVRNSCKELAENTASKHPSAAATQAPALTQPGHQADPATGGSRVLADLLVNFMSTQFVEQTRALFAGQLPRQDLDIHYNKRIPPEAVHHVSGTTAPLTDGAAPLPLANDTAAHVPPAEEKNTDKAANEKDAMDLEAFERQAFEQLQARKPACKAASKKGAMKKPSSSTQQAKPNQKKSTALKLGCKKCRGSKNGCDQCRNAGYTGLRCTKEEWKKLAAKKGLK